MPFDLPTVLAALVAGLLGGLHCAVMCGGIATGLHAMAPGAPLAVACQANLGRIGGYVLAGALAGGLGGGVLRLLRIDALALGLRMAAGLALVLVALRLLDRGGRLDFLARPGVQAWRRLRRRPRPGWSGRPCRPTAPGGASRWALCGAGCPAA